MDNLTTTITDMQEYIAANPTFRKHPVDFPEYKKWVEVYDAIKPREVPTRKSAKAANQKNKGKSKALPTGPSDANPEDLDVEDDNGDPDGDRDGDYGKDGRNARGHRSPGMKLLNALGITKEDFLNRMSDVRNFMKKSFPFALPHRSSDTPYLRIRANKKVYELKAAIFGLKCIPWTWFKISRVPVGVIRANGISLLLYVDDGKIPSPTTNIGLMQTAFTIQLDWNTEIPLIAITSCVISCPFTDLTAPPT